MVNIQHDVVQACIHFLRFPAQTCGVLRHFQTGCCYASRVGRFTRREQYTGFQEQIGGLDGGRHVCPFSDSLHAVGDQHACRIDIKFVLGGARQGDINRNRPRLLAFQIGQAKFAGVIRHAAVAAVFDRAQTRQFFFSKSAFVDHGTAGIGGGDYSRAKLHGFLNGELRHVTGTRDGHAHAFKAQAMAFEHRFGEVHQTVAGSFRANQAAAERETFTGKDAGAVVGQFFHHPGHKADFTTAYADIARRNIGIGS